jgi:histidinol-phosphate/aromatic aminotransferase/cobyric acid decarboxylase-like protein
MCRAPGRDHCRAHPSCRAPAREVARTLGELKAAAGSHSPSIAELERLLPGLIRIDACFPSNPYATDIAMRRLRALPEAALERMVSHYPSQGGAIARLVGRYAGAPAERLAVGNGGSELMGALLRDARGPLLLSLPTFSATTSWPAARS